MLPTSMVLPLGSEGAKDCTSSHSRLAASCPAMTSLPPPSPLAAAAADALDPLAAVGGMVAPVAPPVAPPTAAGGGGGGGAGSNMPSQQASIHRTTSWCGNLPCRRDATACSMHTTCPHPPASKPLLPLLLRVVPLPRVDGPAMPAAAGETASSGGASSASSSCTSRCGCAAANSAGCCATPTSTACAHPCPVHVSSCCSSARLQACKHTAPGVLLLAPAAVPECVGAPGGMSSHRCRAKVAPAAGSLLVGPGWRLGWVVALLLMLLMCVLLHCRLLLCCGRALQTPPPAAGPVCRPGLSLLLRALLLLLEHSWKPGAACSSCHTACSVGCSDVPSSCCCCCCCCCCCPLKWRSPCILLLLGLTGTPLLLWSLLVDTGGWLYSWRAVVSAVDNWGMVQLTPAPMPAMCCCCGLFTTCPGVRPAVGPRPGTRVAASAAV
jgi:hypothetical protein